MHWKTRLIHTTAKAPSGFRSLATAVERGSTVVFGTQAEAHDDWRQDRHGYTYGLYGTPTVLELGARIAELESAHHSFIVPGGQAAIALVYLAYCKVGSHALLPWAAYGPNQDIGRSFLSRLGIEVELYDPMIGPGIAALIRPNTALIWTESPASVTMEVQDVPAIVAAAHAQGVPVALDNTYAAGVMFDAFAHGVDVSLQALTKYVGGHSDILLGSVSVRGEAAYEAVGAAANMLGMGVSPDDAALALRGLLTLGVRLEKLEASTNAVAAWLAAREEVEIVLHPPQASCPGHEVWRRDFTGSASVFSIVMDRRFSPSQVERFADRLRLFKAGYSWGGVTALVMTYRNLSRPGLDYAGRIVRLNIGLETPEDLIADLAQAFEVLKED